LRVQDVDRVLTKDVLSKCVGCELEKVVEIVHADARGHEEVDGVVASEIHLTKFAQLVYGCEETVDVHVASVDH
jgi:hypothetical protein